MPAPLSIAKVPTALRELNQFQENVRSVLNPFLRAGMTVRDVLPALPDASDAWAWRVVGVAVQGKPSKLVICMPGSSGSWQWVTIAQPT